MATDFGFTVPVTKGELATIIDPIVYGDVISALQEPGMTMAGGLVRGQSLLNVLSETYGTKGIFLDNPKIAQIFDLLVYEGILPPTERQKIAEYTAGQLNTPLTPSGQTFAHRYRIPLSALPSNPLAHISDYLTAESSAWIEGDYLRVDTEGACTAPQTEVM